MVARTFACSWIQVSAGIVVLRFGGGLVMRIVDVENYRISYEKKRYEMHANIFLPPGGSPPGRAQQTERTAQQVLCIFALGKFVIVFLWDVLIKSRAPHPSMY